MDIAGSPLYGRFWSRFTVQGAAATGSLSVTRTSLSQIAGTDAPLDIEFDRPIDPATVSGNVWLRRGRTRVPGVVTPRGEQGVRFTPDAPLSEGMEYGVTLGPGLLDATGAPIEAREFRFRTTNVPRPLPRSP
jgi:hypothetical protein